MIGGNDFIYYEFGARRRERRVLLIFDYRQSCFSKAGANNFGMNSPVSRRAWLTRASAGVIASTTLANLPGAAAIDSFQRPGAARLKLSLAAYSFRDFFKDAN